MSKSKQQRRQERLVIFIALVIVVSSILTTLHFTGVLWGGGRGTEAFQNITFTDAVLTCEQRTRGEFPRQLHSLTLDDHSSRFDSLGNEYKIFLRATLLKPGSREGTGEMFVTCIVNGAHGRTTAYEALEQQNSPTDVIRRDTGGAFGWPR